MLRSLLVRLQRAPGRIGRWAGVACRLAAAGAAPVRAQPAPQPAPADSVHPRVKVPDRTALETVATIPSAVVLLPFEVLFGATTLTLDFVENNHVVVRVIDFLQSGDGTKTVVPVYSGRAGVGLRYRHLRLFGPASQLDIKAMGFFDSRQTFEARLRRVRFAGGQLGAATLARYQFLPHERFYGIGQDSKEADETEYEFERTTAQLDADTDLTHTLQATAGVQWTKSNVRATRGPAVPPPGDATAPPAGNLERPQIVRLQALVTWDGGDNKGRPGRRSQAVLGAAVAEEVTSGSFGWTEWHAAFTRDVSLGYGRTLAIGASTTVLEPGKDRSIPFYDLASLGGRESLRGYDRDRFRDEGMLRASAEYRFPVHPKGLDGALFVDTGRVFSDLFQEDPARAFHTGYGIGLRLWNARGVFGTADLAYSREGWHAYVSLN